jgi:hypothetical protein
LGINLTPLTEEERITREPTDVEVNLRATYKHLIDIERRGYGEDAKRMAAQDEFSGDSLERYAVGNRDLPEATAQNNESEGFIVWLDVKGKQSVIDLKQLEVINPLQMCYTAYDNSTPPPDQGAAGAIESSATLNEPGSQNLKYVRRQDTKDNRTFKGENLCDECNLWFCIVSLQHKIHSAHSRQLRKPPSKFHKVVENSGYELSEPAPGEVFADSGKQRSTSSKVVLDLSTSISPSVALSAALQAYPGSVSSSLSVKHSVALEGDNSGATEGEEMAIISRREKRSIALPVSTTLALTSFRERISKSSSRHPQKHISFYCSKK